jgi:hypothetical protein
MNLGLVTGALTSMKESLMASGALGKILATLAIAAGLMMYGCSKESERSESSKEQFKNISETESRLLTSKGKVTRKGAGAPKSIKGKLAGIEKENTEGQ